MVLFIVENYRKIYPDLEGKPLTDRLVAELLSQNLPDRSKVKIQIQRTESGKPYVVWNRDQQAPCISVSHCDGVFACAFDDENVGIDIQNEREVAADRIKGRYLGFYVGIAAAVYPIVQITQIDIIKFNFMAMIAVASLLILTFTGLDRFVPLFAMPREPEVQLKKNMDKVPEAAA